MNKNNINKEFMIAAIFTIVLILTSLYGLFIGDGEKIFRTVLTFITIVIAYMLFKKSFLKGSKYYLLYKYSFHIFINVFSKCLEFLWNT